ncbi:EpsG family protein [Sphingomonas hengshuiensis]|nr:EpsG family protein [Sphingomonas hengshuiensis]
MALVFPVERYAKLGATQGAAMLLFLSAYVLLATFRNEIGGDWEAYKGMYEAVRGESLVSALQTTDPIFGFILWLSSLLRLGIYPVNGICAALIGMGVLRVALTTRDPWLAIVMAVPYLLIVVGMGYVRQAGAIGFLMLAIASLDRRRIAATAVRLLFAAGLHSTSAIVFPVFGFAMAGRRRVVALILGCAGLVLFSYVLSWRIEEFQAGYLQSEYDSSGALVRVAMNVAPSILLLACWRRFPITGPARIVWLALALANIAALIALWLSPSSSAVDRLSLYFAPIQIVACGTIRDLLPMRRAAAYPIRMAVIAAAALVQTAWLLLADNAFAWVPYHSVLDAL